MKDNIEGFDKFRSQERGFSRFQLLKKLKACGGGGKGLFLMFSIKLLSCLSP